MFVTLWESGVCGSENLGVSKRPSSALVELQIPHWKHNDVVPRNSQFKQFDSLIKTRSERWKEFSTARYRCRDALEQGNISCHIITGYLEGLEP